MTSFPSTSSRSGGAVLLPEFTVLRQPTTSPPVSPKNAPHPILYAHTLCPYAERVFLTLLEKNAGPFTLCHIDLSSKPTWYRRKINPRGLVPAVEFQGKVHVESLQLLKWANGLKGDDAIDLLAPPAESNCNSETTNGGEVDDLIEEGSRLVDAGLSLLAGSGRYWGIGSESSRSASSWAEFEQRVESAISVPLRRNGGRGPYLLGERVSLADIALFPFMKRFAVAIPAFCGGQDVPKEAKDWVAAMMDRPTCRITSADDAALRAAFERHRSLDFFDYESYDVWDLHPQNISRYPIMNR